MPLSSKPPVSGSRLNHRLNELIGILLLVAATLLFLALISYRPSDASLDTALPATAPAERPANLVGPAGAYVADVLFQLFGLPVFLFSGALAMTGFGRLRAPAAARPLLNRWKLTGVGLCTLASGALLAELPIHVRWRSAIPIQGAAGSVLANFLTAGFNPLGALILASTLLVGGVFLATTFSVNQTVERFALRFGPRLAPLLWPLRKLQARWRSWRDTRRQRALLRKAPHLVRKPDDAPPQINPTFIPARNRPQPFEDAATRARRELATDPAVLARTGVAAAPAEPWAMPASAPAAAAPASGNLAGADSAFPVSQTAERTLPQKPLRPRVAGGYKLPSVSLLQEPGEGERIDEAELRRVASVLQSKCEEFDVRGQVTQINPGPVVTTYEYKPEPGIKYNRITGLVDDLCLALEAESIYIERIPGKSTVGVEVPNRRRETIFLREVVESEEFHASRSRLTMALGKDINGHIVIADLAAMPHLLIAGSTGSGKSVALNSMIVSLLYKSTPDEVRLILVDPKRLELGLYDGIPHLYTPIITEPKLAANALRNATREMERRLKLLATQGVRNIGQFNRLFEDRPPGLFDAVDDDPDNRPLPYIVIVIDELADLMIVDASNVEESITRLAQMARAVGIHLILATQRPSVDVITGLIKANFPARMSFRVATKVDSRTILDAQGAESLLGKGDMLFLPPGSSRFHRVHGAFITEREITAAVDFWRRQAPPQLDESFLKPPDEAPEMEIETGESENSGDDPMYEDAVRVVLEYGKASTSLLQRRLRIGYGRAAHLIDLMYNDGIVGPADGPKPREVLKRPDWLSEVAASQAPWEE